MTEEHDDPTLVGEEGGHEARLAKGVAVGRYVINRRIGAGGMGVVYAAHDPKLDRPVAVKLLHLFAEQSPERAREGQLRLAREARAMARLTHSNVVTVHDVGESDGHVFIAMDLVDGVTLTRWLRDASPSVAEITEVFVQAGRGLSAAHEAGLVHRDFKPDNVMVCHDARGRLTRVLVMDFGLAHDTGPTAELAAMAADLAAVTYEVSVPDDTTRTGGVRGTPAYMSPEQHLGDAVGAASDQFSYCVALYEALFGHRPFEGDGVAALAFAVIEGKVRETPPNSHIPQWLVRVLVRGLSVQPELRWPSMEALLRELSRERGRAVRVGAVVGVLLLGVAAVWASAGDNDDPCADVGQGVLTAWDEAVGDGVQRQRLDVTRTSASGPASIARAMDTYAAAWAEARVQACRDARRGDRDAAAPRLACLEGRRRHFMAVVSLLTGPVAEWGDDPGKAVAALPPLLLCADAAYLAAQVEPPQDETLRMSVAGLRTTLSRVEVLEDAGRYSEAMALGEPALLHARTLGYAPATAEAAHRLAVAHLELGQTSTAITLLEEAYLAASGAEHTLVAARAAIALVFAHGVNERHADEARTWIEHARAQVERAARPRSLQCALRTTEATVAWTESRYDDAVQLAKEALVMARAEAAEGSDIRSVARLLQNLGLYETSAGRAADGIKYFEQAVILIEAEFGPEHVMMGKTLGNMGMALSSNDEPERALEAYTRALAIRERLLGPEHPDLATVVQNIAIVHAERGNNAEALPMFERALAIREAALAPDHALLGSGHLNLGISLGLAGRSQDAVLHLRRALDISVTALGERDVSVGMIHFELGNHSRTLGKLDDALEHHNAARSILSEALGAKHPNMVIASATLAETLQARGEHEPALSMYRAALSLGEEVGLRESELAMVRLGMAQMLFEHEPRRRADALAMARRSVAALPEGEPARVQAEAWLAEHAAPR